MTRESNSRVPSSSTSTGTLPRGLHSWTGLSGGHGDISESHKLWSFGNGPDVPTPVADGKYFYSVNDRGILWCLEAKTGKEVWGAKRIAPAIYSSSPVLADGKITVKSDPVKEVLEWFKKAVPFFPPSAFAWDNAANNKWLISGQGAFIMNPPGAWAVAPLQVAPL